MASEKALRQQRKQKNPPCYYTRPSPLNLDSDLCNNRDIILILGYNWPSYIKNCCWFDHCLDIFAKWKDKKPQGEIKWQLKINKSHGLKRYSLVGTYKL